MHLSWEQNQNDLCISGGFQEARFCIQSPLQLQKPGYQGDAYYNFLKTADKAANNSMVRR